MQILHSTLFDIFLHIATIYDIGVIVKWPIKKTTRYKIKSF